PSVPAPLQRMGTQRLRRAPPPQQCDARPEWLQIPRLDPRIAFLTRTEPSSNGSVRTVAAHGVDSTNLLPSTSRKIAAVPQSAFCGSCTNSTPFAPNSAAGA